MDVRPITTLGGLPTTTEAKVSAWALFAVGILMVAGAAVCAWVSLSNLRAALLLLPFAAYLLQRATVIFGFFVVGPSAQMLDALVNGHSSRALGSALKSKRSAG